MPLFCYLFFLSFPFLLNSLPLSPEPIPADWPIWLAIERVLPSPDGEGDAILIRPELCQRQCAELIGTGAEQIPRARCVCRCPKEEPVFVQQQKARGQCAQRIAECPGRPIFFENSQNPRPQFVPAISLPRAGEPIADELRIAWKESGVKVRQSQGPRCSIRAANFLGNVSEWRELDARRLFEPGWTEGNGRVLWTGNDADAQQLAGGIVNLELECVAGKNGNSTFCLSFRIEGQIEAAGGVGKAPPGPIGMELERGRRAEVVVIILLVILLFLSLFGSIFMWNVCWRMHKRKLVHSLQMQFVHYARQEKEKAISECQLRYQALVKAAAGIRNAEEANQGTTTATIGYINNDVGGGPPSFGENVDQMQGQQQQNGRRKLYFSSEFFEPQLMSSPPPMAEQFLYDLRKMITCARERIRTRRHVPRLPPVVESEDEGPVAGNGNVAIGKLAKNSEEFEAQILEKEVERPKINVAIERRTEAEELALSMEEIVREQQKRRDKKEAENEENEGELVHQRRDGKMEENGSTSARSSMDSGRGSEKREEEEMQEEQAKEEETKNEEVVEVKNGEENELEEHLEGENAQNVEENDNEIVENVANEQKMPQPSNNLPTLNSSTPSIQQQSRIPVGTASTSNNQNSSGNSGKSPRLQLKFTAFCRRPPPLPPRPPPPPPSNAPGKSSTESAAIEGKPKVGQNPLAAMKRRIATNSERNEPSKLQQPSSIPIGNSYAVCPPPSFACADRMKKSLPRRKKAIVPMAPNVTTTTTVLPKATPTAV